MFSLGETLARIIQRADGFNPSSGLIGVLTVLPLSKGEGDRSFNPSSGLIGVLTISSTTTAAAPAMFQSLKRVDRCSHLIWYRRTSTLKQFQSLKRVDRCSHFLKNDGGELVTRCFNPSSGLIGVLTRCAGLLVAQAWSFNPSSGLIGVLTSLCAAFWRQTGLFQSLKRVDRCSHADAG